MALPATDGFAGTNGQSLTAYSASWTHTTSSAFAINTSAYYATTGSDSLARWNADTFPNDQYAQATMVATDIGSSNGRGVAVRVSTAGPMSGYALYGGGGSAEVSLLNAGSASTLGSTFAGCALNDIMRLEVVGTTLTVKKNGSTVTTRTDSTFTSGAAGISGYNTSTLYRMDTWEGGSMGGSSPTADQERFRFRNDDGSETTATWDAAENTNLTQPFDGGNVRLRLQVDATGDYASTQFRLDHKISTGGTYTAVPTSSAATTMPVYQLAGTGVESTTSASVAWPSHVAGDIALLFVESCGGEPVTLSTPSGFQGVANSPQATGAGTAGTQLSVFWCRATSGAMANPVVADPGDHVWAVIVTFRGCIDTGNPWDVTAGSVKASASTTTTFPSVTTTLPNCLIVLAASRDNDLATAAWSAPVNAALSSITERQDLGTALGNGGGTGVQVGGKATAGSTGTTSATVTSSINAMMTIALKPPPLPIYLSPSANITASGQATTAQLTAPAGKTTSNFTAGRMMDDENPADAVDIANNFYTELEWCIAADTSVPQGAIYQFRVTANGTALDAYTQTPQWTVQAATVTGTGSSTAAAGSSASTGLEVGTGTASSIAASPTTAATGSEVFTGTGASIATASSASTGTYTPPAVTGTGSSVAVSGSSASVGVEVFAATGSSSAASPASAGIAIEKYIGTGASTATAASTGTGVEIFGGGIGTSTATASTAVIAAEVFTATASSVAPAGTTASIGGGLTSGTASSVATASTAATGVEVFAGSASSAAIAGTSSSVGKSLFVGSASSTATASSASVGVEKFIGTATSTATAATAGSGVTFVLGGNATSTATASSASTGVEIFIGNGSSTATANSSGTAGGLTVGTITSTTAPSSSVSAGTVTQPGITGTGSSIAAKGTTAVSGIEIFAGTASATATASNAGTGSQTLSGTGSSAAVAGSTAIAALEKFIGTVSSVAGAPATAAVGQWGYQGTASSIAAAPATAATGIYTPPAGVGNTVAAAGTTALVGKLIFIANGTSISTANTSATGVNTPPPIFGTGSSVAGAGQTIATGIYTPPGINGVGSSIAPAGQTSASGSFLYTGVIFSRAAAGNTSAIGYTDIIFVQRGYAHLSDSPLGMAFLKEENLSHPQLTEDQHWIAVLSNS